MADKNCEQPGEEMYPAPAACASVLAVHEGRIYLRFLERYRPVLRGFSGVGQHGVAIT